ncbi:MAG: DUF4252 domain-containing protein [Candidatus Symbiothrix sp.]|nr:DUF4252 domain-containing protein [Candidatus Symbiothrix sp.]
MKKMMLSLVVLTALCVSSCATTCRQNSNQQILSALADNDDVTTLSVGSFGMFFAQMLGAFDELPALKGIKSVEFFSISDCPKNRCDKINRQIASLHDDGEYSTLLQVKDKDNNVRMFIRQDDDLVKELLLAVVSDNDDSAVIRIKGKIKLSDVQELAEKTQIKISKKD